MSKYCIVKQKKISILCYCIDIDYYLFIYFLLLGCFWTWLRPRWNTRLVPLLFQSEKNSVPDSMSFGHIWLFPTKAALYGGEAFHILRWDSISKNHLCICYTQLCFHCHHALRVLLLLSLAYTVHMEALLSKSPSTYSPYTVLFCWNSLTAPYEFTTEKLMFVVRSLKERLVINLESLLLHGNEDFREQILDREEKGGKSLV